MHYREIEMLENILSLIEEKRQQANHRYLNAKASADAGMDHQGSTIKMGMNEVIAKQMADLKGEIECIIDEELGADWKTA